MADSYGARSLTVLEGLDAVRKRPGMYIGTTDSQGLMHCLWEIIDNSVDEALAGVCTHIVVTLHTDGSITVADNGRGIPVDIEPKTGLTGVEVVLTKLHAGAKFGNSSYNAVGGLHGVGSSVVNALSSRLDVEVDRNGKTYRMEFHQGHPGIFEDADSNEPSPASHFVRTRKNKPTELREVGKVSRKTTGTRIRYWADPEIFNETAHFSYDQLIDRVRQTSFLVPGLMLSVIAENVDESVGENISENVDENVGEHNVEDFDDHSDVIADQHLSESLDTTPTHHRVVEFMHEGGVKDFVDFLTVGEPISDIWHVTGEANYEEETQKVEPNGELKAERVKRVCGVDIAMRWVNGYETTMRSFVNVVETPGGGMHVDGYLNALTRQVRKCVEENARKLKVNLRDSHTKIEREDILAGLVVVVTVRIAEPQFQGQTK
ncbi:MAG: ATP-binding protein, partial [Bifidobacterium aquikefiri]|uniref:ATP-binding protein n=1 Tax=Bifidobacterium aquikefiri TaxID=1653207 RepID=UPI0039E87D5B